MPIINLDERKSNPPGYIAVTFFYLKGFIFHVSKTTAVSSTLQTFFPTKLFIS